MRGLPFNDEWILENASNLKNYRELAEEHNKLFGTSFSRMQMKNHAGLILGVKMNKYWYTEDQKQWIIENYPKPGTADDKAKEFNSIFCTKRSGQTIKEMARLLGVSLSEEGMAEYKKKSKEHIVNYNRTERSTPIGEFGRPTGGGYICRKMEDGSWMLRHRYEYEKHHGEIKKGNVVIFLDGNKENFNPQNLAQVPLSYQGMMTAHKLWSIDPDITRTSIRWCDLYSVMLRKER